MPDPMKHASQPKKYPPFYEKVVPIALVVIALAIIALIVIALSVVFGVFPNLG